MQSKHPEASLRVNALSTEAQSDSVAILDGDVHLSRLPPVAVIAQK